MSSKRKDENGRSGQRVSTIVAVVSCAIVVVGFVLFDVRIRRAEAVISEVKATAIEARERAEVAGIDAEARQAMAALVSTLLDLVERLRQLRDSGEPWAQDAVNTIEATIQEALQRLEAYQWLPRRPEPSSVAFEDNEKSDAGAAHESEAALTAEPGESIMYSQGSAEAAGNASYVPPQVAESSSPKPPDASCVLLEYQDDRGFTHQLRMSEAWQSHWLRLSLHAERDQSISAELVRALPPAVMQAAASSGCIFVAADPVAVGELLEATDAELMATSSDGSIIASLHPEAGDTAAIFVARYRSAVDALALVFPKSDAPATAEVALGEQATSVVGATVRKSVFAYVDVAGLVHRVELVPGELRSESGSVIDTSLLCLLMQEFPPLFRKEQRGVSQVQGGSLGALDTHRLRTASAALKCQWFGPSRQIRTIALENESLAELLRRHIAAVYEALDNEERMAPKDL